MYTTHLLKRRWLSDNTFEVEFTRPKSFHFIPGQHIRFVHNQREREYSLISLPSEPIISLLVRKIHHGTFSVFLASAPPGTECSFSGPYGYLTFHRSERQPVFIATGTGIAPFISIVRSGVSDVILLHGGRVPSELYYAALFKDVGKQYIPCLSCVPDECPVPYNGFRGRVTAYLTNHLPINRYDFYLCGLQTMIRDVTFLVDERFPHSLLKAEAFY
jgi:ferredoxin-NADP reductase